MMIMCGYIYDDRASRSIDIPGSRVVFFPEFYSGVGLM